MDNGYWDDKTIKLCTDSFSYDEVPLRSSSLHSNFGLIATVNKRVSDNKNVCYRIRFSSKYDNFDKLCSLVLPYFIPSMFYKLNL